MADKFQLILESKQDLAPGSQHFRFRCDNETFVYKAGQFISLHIEKDGVEHRRNYSIANPPGVDNFIELAMSYVPNGLASNLLHKKLRLEINCRQAAHMDNLFSKKSNYQNVIF